MKYAPACNNRQFGNCHNDELEQRCPAAIVLMMWECIAARLHVLQHLVDFHGVNFWIIPSPVSYTHLTLPTNREV